MSSLSNLDKGLNQATPGEPKPLGVLPPPGLEKVPKDIEREVKDGAPIQHEPNRCKCACCHRPCRCAYSLKRIGTLFP